ncbi:MAG: type II toxin-antitoxin system death-on-curing family toxin [Lewinellaceae bacterium]|nr:type II toxin-antitoxin system death-on-curing family toxin [Lewinellaceae bacterium]
MITLEVVVSIHGILIKRYGGIPGIRDRGALESAVNRPYQTFNGEGLYKTSVEKAAALIESIVKNHPFLDGNKRTGYSAMRILLRKDRKDIQASEEEKYEFVLNIAEGKSEFDEIKGWIEKKIIELADR